MDVERIFAAGNKISYIDVMDVNIAARIWPYIKQRWYRRCYTCVEITNEE